MTEQRDGLLKENPSTEISSLLLYSTTIQQNMSYSNSLHDEIYNLRKTGKEVSAEIEDRNGDVVRIKSEIEKIKVDKAAALQTKIDKIREQIEALQLQKEMVRNIKLIKNLAPVPVKSKKKKMVVLLPAVVGFFFFTFLAFVVEYIKRNLSKFK